MIFSAQYNNLTDNELITHALSGNKPSLEALVKRHQNYIFNISLRLFTDPDDALDATQEVLIKMVTHLKTFRGESEFRTWLYRIAFNHFLNSPPKRVETLLQHDREQFSGYLTDDTEENYDENSLEEVRILCSTAMLMCLSREQRLLYIVGEVFGADHQVGAALFDTTPANYRVKLHRAKADLLSFISGKCGIVNPENPCRCPKKTRSFIEMGVVDRQNLRFNANFEYKIKDFVETHRSHLSDTVQLHLQALFKDSPFQIKQELDRLLGEVLK